MHPRENARRPVSRATRLIEPAPPISSGSSGRTRGAQCGGAQCAAALRGNWGGQRAGAGRPRNSRKVPHSCRAELRRHHPLHVTLRLAPGLARLRSPRGYVAVDHALRATLGDERLRVVHLSVQSNHLHLIVETSGKRPLARAVQGLAVRLARGYNRVFGRRGRVFSDRYYARALKTPLAVRNALRYVLLNESHHFAERQRRRSVLANVLVESDGRWRRVPSDRALPPSAYRPPGARLVGDDAEVRREATPLGSWILEECCGARAGPTRYLTPGEAASAEGDRGQRFASDPSSPSRVDQRRGSGTSSTADADQRWWSDPFSSAALLDGWRILPIVEVHAWGAAAAPIVPAHTWLLRVGWRT
jgi:hypothetical protein